MRSAFTRVRALSLAIPMTAGPLAGGAGAQPPRLPAGDAGGFFDLRAQRMAAFEREYLTTLMRQRQGDVSRGAREARMPRGTLYRLMKRHDIDPDAFRNRASAAGGGA